MSVLAGMVEFAVARGDREEELDDPFREFSVGDKDGLEAEEEGVVPRVKLWRGEGAFVDDEGRLEFGAGTGEWTEGLGADVFERL